MHQGFAELSSGGSMSRGDMAGPCKWSLADDMTKCVLG